MKVRIIVPVLHSDELVGKAREEYQASASPGVELSVACLPNGTRSIESEYDMALAQPEVIRLVREAERDGVDACTIACFGDPGAAGAKELVSIPVIGEGEAAMHCASLLGTRFSVVITERAIFPLVHRLVRATGMEHRFASVREVGAGVLDFSLESVPRAIDESVAAVREDGADVIVMGCTGTGVDMARAIEEGVKQRLGAYVPVIDPVKVTMKLAESFAAIGLSHSKVAYPTPPSPRPEYRFVAA
jgi:allantoin racemase